MEILGDQIRNNDSINGIKVDNIEIKSMLFADDMNLFLEYKQESVQSATDTLITFEKNTGLKLNYDKTNVCRIGSSKNSDVHLCTSKQLNWTNNTIKILAIDLYHDDRQLRNVNYVEVLTKIEYS